VFGLRKIVLIGLWILVGLTILPSTNALSEVVVTSDNSADYAVAQVLAWKLTTNLLITPWGSLSSEVELEVDSRRPTVIYVVGGSAAVPNAESVFGAYGVRVIRLGGKNREETSLSVAQGFPEKIGFPVYYREKKAVVLDGYDTVALEDAVTLGKNQSATIIFFRNNDVLAGEKLSNAGITDVTIIPNPSFGDETRSLINSSGILISETTRDVKKAAHDMIDSAESEITKANELVKTIKDGPSLAGARLIVESEIELIQAKEFLENENYKEAFSHASASEIAAIRATIIYGGRSQGELLELTSQGLADIHSAANKLKSYNKGIYEVKEELKKTAATFGVGLPISTDFDIEIFIRRVEVPNYTKSEVMNAEQEIFNHVGAVFTRNVGQSVNVEIHDRADNKDAVDWVEQSSEWESTTLMGYPARIKRITYTVTDKKNEEVFLRVAVGKYGVFSRFTQSVGGYDDLLPLEEAQKIVEEVTSEVIRAIEETI
jgi:putative cell wall-binding protein